MAGVWHNKTAILPAGSCFFNQGRALGVQQHQRETAPYHSGIFGSRADLYRLPGPKAFGKTAIDKNEGKRGQAEAMSGSGRACGEGMREKHYVARRRHRYAAPLGAIFMILAVIGAVAVIVTSVKWTGQILDNQGEKTKFEKIITPAIIFDPMTFEDASKADPLFLLESSMWADLLNRDQKEYVYDEMGMLVVPASDVDVAAKQLYGDSVKLEHQTFGDYEVSYVYDEETKVYHVPVMGQTGLYTPRVEKIVKNGDSYELTVAYIPPSNLWTMKLDGKRIEPDPDKYMIYVLKQSGKSYILTAIRDLPEDQKNAVSSSSGSESSSSQTSSAESSQSSSQAVDPSTATQR